MTNVRFLSVLPLTFLEFVKIFFVEGVGVTPPAYQIPQYRGGAPLAAGVGGGTEKALKRAKTGHATRRDRCHLSIIRPFDRKTAQNGYRRVFYAHIYAQKYIKMQLPPQPQTPPI